LLRKSKPHPRRESEKFRYLGGMEDPFRGEKNQKKTQVGLHQTGTTKPSLKLMEIMP